MVLCQSMLWRFEVLHHVPRPGAQRCLFKAELYAYLSEEILRVSLEPLQAVQGSLESF